MKNISSDRANFHLVIILSVLLAFVIAIICTAPSKAFAENTSVGTKGGYWELADTELIAWEKNKNPTVRTHESTYITGETQHVMELEMKWYSSNPIIEWNYATNSWFTSFPPDEDDDIEVHTEHAVFTSTCSTPPSRIEPGGTIKFQLTSTVEDDNPDGALAIGDSTYVVRNYSYYRANAGNTPSNITASQTALAPTVEGAPDECFVSTNPYEKFQEVYSCEVQYTFPDPEKDLNEGRSVMSLSLGEDNRDQDITFAFIGSGSDTVWTYRWVKGKEVADGEIVEDPYINKTENINASNTSGNQNSSNIDPNIINGREDDNNWIFIPLGIAVVAGGALVVRYLKKRKPDNPNDPNKQEQQRYTYKMTLYKDFGDTMTPGRTYEVCARIDKQPVSSTGVPMGAAAPDQQLSSAIQVASAQNLNVVGAMYRTPYMVGKVQVPEQPKNITQYPDAVVRFTYAGRGGAYNAQVAFKVKANQAILWCDEKGDTIARSKMVGDCLAGDVQGVIYYFEAADFIDEPKIDFQVSDNRCDVNIDKHVVPTDPTGFYYKVSLCWTEAPFNQYDSWPYPAYIDIQAHTEIQEAEGRMDVKAWYDGIGIDIKHLYVDTQFAGDAIIINTADFPVTKDLNYKIKETKVGMFAAYKNKRGEVEVYCPNQPEQKSLARIEPVTGDPDSERIFSKDDPRFWYNLRLFATQIDPSTDDHRTGVVNMKPCFPLLIADETDAFRGTFKMSYVNQEEGVQIDGDMDYIIRGLCEAGYLNSRQEEIRAIARILAGMNANGLQEAYDIVSNFSGESKNLPLKLGNDEKRAALAETSQSIMAKLNNIYSVQRLRFMREELFRAAVAYQQNDGLTIAGVHYTWQNLADYADCAYKIALITRWADDIAFTCWWYMLLGPKAAYVEPIMTPLKNWCLEYLEMLSTYAFDPDEEYKTLEQFFAADKCWEKWALPAIEGELFSCMASAAATHGTALLTQPKALAAIGAIMCFMFANNCTKCSKYDPKTGKAEVDLWKALKKTTLQMTAFTLKVVLSAVLARKVFASYKVDEVKAELPFTNPESVSEKFFNTMARGMEAIGEWVVVPTFGASKRLFSSIQIDKLTQSMTQNEIVDCVQAIYCDAPTQYAIDKVNSEVLNGEGNTLNSVRSFGAVVPWKAKDPATGQEITIKIPILTAAYLFIDELLYLSGIESLQCLQMDYSTVLPDDCPYKTREEMIEILKEHRMDVEANFLANPRPNVIEFDENYLGPGLGDHDSIVPQMIYHEIQR